MKPLIYLAIALLIFGGCSSNSKHTLKPTEEPSSVDYSEKLPEELLPLAENGDAAAQFYLGVSYDLGQGIVQDYQAAIKWYTLAAKQGDATAQNNLGLLYLRGQGVPQNYIQAHKWLNLSAAQGDTLAIKERDQLAEKMTPSQLEKAQELASQWKRKEKLSSDKPN